MGKLRRGLADRLADLLAQDIFYIAESSSESEPLPSPSFRETLAYFLRTGHLPTRSYFTLIASGGSAKGYYSWGIVSKLKQLGLKIDEMHVNSVTAFLALTEFKDYEELHRFALGIPELIEPVSVVRRYGEYTIADLSMMSRKAGELIEDYAKSVIQVFEGAINAAVGPHVNFLDRSAYQPKIRSQETNQEKPTFFIELEN